MIGNERSGTIAVYSIDERLAAIAPKFETLIHGVTRLNDTWNNLYAARAVSMLDPEDVSVNPTVRYGYHQLNSHVSLNSKHCAKRNAI
ncbi:hypothetical protein DPMN_067017 [Dreissena polymorpha]|uniref:Uncharacterized protein n=1 Tax=Dreissena polymorpha TaxID=45954 RepID=A0A9D3YZI3_DREPO|nr:hypothetical protein DPMN_067017 [Dreissena polymorpha]